MYSDTKYKNVKNVRKTEKSKIKNVRKNEEIERGWKKERNMKEKEIN